MPGFNITVGHGLTQDKAMERIKRELAGLKTQFADKISGLHEDWNGNNCQLSLSVMGFSGSGNISVGQSEVKVSGNLPIFAIPFKDKIESTIRERLGKLLV